MTTLPLANPAPIKDPAGEEMPAEPAPRVRFSVIINIYNGEEFLNEAIDSVLGQSFGDWELILWDDRSSDRSEAICRSYNDPRLRYFLSPDHTGIAAARDAAAQLATGDWIAFLDQDDIWLPDKLAAQNRLIERDRSGRLALVYGRTVRFDRRGRLSPFDRWHGKGRLPDGEIFAELLRKPSFVALSSVVFRRSALVELGHIPANIVYCPDYYLCLAIARHHDVACVQEACCLYRLHPSSMSHVFRKEIHKEALQIIENAAGPSQRRILRVRRWVHESWIGVEEMRSLSTWWQGVTRILSKGSLLYLVCRPFVLMGRGIRQRMLRCL